MLTKLLKYDLKAIFKPLIPIYIVTLLLAILQRFTTFIGDQWSVFKIPAGFITGFYIVILIALPIATFIFSIIKYYQNLAKDEGYLMHTLPVSKGKLVLSKLISAFLSILASIVVMIAALSITFAGIVSLNDISIVFKTIADYTDPLFIILMILSAIVGYVSQQLLFYLSMALGQKHNNRKVLYSIIYGIVLYNVVQIVSSLLLLAPALFNRDFQDMLFNNATPSMGFLNAYLGVALVMSVVIIGIFYLCTTKILEHHLNLD